MSRLNGDVRDRQSASRLIIMKHGQNLRTCRMSARTDLSPKPDSQQPAHFLLLCNADRTNSGCRLLTRPAVQHIVRERRLSPKASRLRLEARQINERQVLVIAPDPANDQIKGANGPFPVYISALEIDLTSRENKTKSE